MITLTLEKCQVWELEDLASTTKANKTLVIVASLPVLLVLIYSALPQHNSHEDKSTVCCYYNYMFSQGIYLSCVSANTRVIKQSSLQKFQEEMGAVQKDPYRVVMRQSKLPMSLLHDRVKAHVSRRGIKVLVWLHCMFILLSLN